MISYGQNAVPVMGEGVSVFDVDVEELSGLCFNEDATELLSCGDQGVVKSISFTGKVKDISAVMWVSVALFAVYIVLKAMGLA